MKPILICMAMLCCTMSFGQKWTESYDKFTKEKSWETKFFNLKLKSKGFFDSPTLSLKLDRTQKEISGVFMFSTSFEYEYLASKDTRITFLYDNDSTAVAKVTYGKSSLIHFLGTAFYNAWIYFPASYLTKPIKAIRIHLEEAAKDYDLKKEGTIELITYMNRALENMVKD